MKADRNKQDYPSGWWIIPFFLGSCLALGLIAYGVLA